MLMSLDDRMNGTKASLREYRTDMSRLLGAACSFFDRCCSFAEPPRPTRRLRDSV
jgi:hypothetical protein